MDQAEQDQAERELCAKYPPGTKVTYVDSGNVNSGTDVVMATGSVNGPCLAAAIPDGLMGYVPVFTSRDNGREPTSIYVAEPNIIEAVKP